jgi:copper resistance protein B
MRQNLLRTSLESLLAADFKQVLIKFVGLAFIFIQEVSADEHDHGKDHAQTFHAFTLEAAAGEGRNGNSQSWDLNGWAGGDYNRLWLKSEGEVTKNQTKNSNIEILYGRNISQFWDAQIGIRRDFKERTVNHLQIGFEGLAPQSFETEFHAFLSEDGDFSLRLRQEFDIFLTQWLITQPYFELRAFSQDVAMQEIKSGISNAKIGIITRYEITRKFAPYVNFSYESKTSNTEKLAKKNGELVSDFLFALGVRLRF